MNPNFIRWVRASTEDFFNNAKGPYHMYFEEDPNRWTSAQSEYYEFRMDGPSVSELSQGEYLVYMEVNILVTGVITSSVHDIDNMIGRIVSAMLAEPIPIYKYGVASNPENDQTLIDCIQLMQDRRHDRLEVNRFGRIHQDTALKQATVEGHYQMTLSL